MKKLSIFFISFFLLSSIYAQEGFEEYGDLGVFENIQKKGVVRDKDTAIIIATAIASSIYGKEEIYYQKPFKVLLVNDVWIVTGSLPERALGGVFMVKISKKNGCIILVTHGA